MSDISFWLVDVLARKPICKDEMDGARVKSSVLKRKGLASPSMYAASYLYEDPVSFFEGADFDTPPKDEDEVFLVQAFGETYIVDTEGYEYPRYVGLVVDCPYEEAPK